MGFLQIDHVPEIVQLQLERFTYPWDQVGNWMTRYIGHQLSQITIIVHDRCFTISAMSELQL